MPGKKRPSKRPASGGNPGGSRPKISSIMAAEADMSNVLRVVLLGKTGMGKSSTGNTLLGRQAFREVRGQRSGTARCQWAEEEVEGVTLQITDTPGLSDTDRPEEEVVREVGKSIALARPGPHVILTVVRCDVRYTEEEAMAYLTLKNMLGPDVKNYMIVIFARTDDFGDTLEEQRTAVKREIVDTATGPMKDLLDDADRRFYALNNKASPADKRRQAAELIDMMKALKRDHGGRYFQNDLSDRVNQMVEDLVEARRARDHTSRAQATRDTNRAIVEERVSEVFTMGLNAIVQPVLCVAAAGAGVGLAFASEGLQIVGKGLHGVADTFRDYLPDNDIVQLSAKALKVAANVVQGAGEVLGRGAEACVNFASKCSIM